MLGHVLIARATKIASLMLKKYQKSQVVKILFLSYSKRFAVFFPNNYLNQVQYFIQISYSI